MCTPRSISDLIANLQLKEMEASLLRTGILNRFESRTPAGAAAHLKVAEAIDFASYAHRSQTRQNRGSMPKVHYIEHPLRGALRALRYGAIDPDVIIAIILHDVVEDCAEIIAHEVCSSPSGADARSVSLAYISEQFGSEVARIVLALTNPVSPDGLTRQQKNAVYIEHVLAGITDPKVFVAKFVDFVDNALSLHHSVNPGMVTRLATKYLPLVEPFRERLSHADLTTVVPADGVRRMLEHLNGNQLETQSAA